MIMPIKKKQFPAAALAVFLILFAGISAWTFAQEGHPLDGTWSGDRIINGDKIRVLLIMRLLPDQEIEGTLIENGARIPLNNVTLNPENWSVNIQAQGENRAGDSVNYSVEGVIENLGSSFDRTIVGTWRDGGEVGEFSVRMN